MFSDNNIFHRAELLLGSDAMERLVKAKVIVFGTGGVGSWCAEALVRTGVRHLTIVDFDVVSHSNVNRQLMATTKTVGQPKVEAMRRHLLEINPDAEITAIEGRFTAETADNYLLDKYDYIVDAIDSVNDKAELILRSTATTARLFSSMGAALKTDPAQVRVSEFWKVSGCPLARALRSKFKRGKTFPRKKFLCAYSTEQPVRRQRDDNGPNGSLVHITAIFGMTIAGLVINDICKA